MPLNYPTGLEIPQEHRQALDTQLDDAIAAAVARATEPFANYQQVQDELAELRRSQETEVQRQVREAKEAAEASVPTAVAAATAAARTSLIQAELRSFAVQYRFEHPEDVIELLSDHKDITVTDDFKVKGVEKLVKDLAEKRPTWLVPEGSFAPGRPSSRPGDGAAEPSAEELVARRIQMRQRIGAAGNRF